MNYEFAPTNPANKIKLTSDFDRLRLQTTCPLQDRRYVVQLLTSQPPLCAGAALAYAQNQADTPQLRRKNC